MANITTAAQQHLWNITEKLQQQRALHFLLSREFTQFTSVAFIVFLMLAHQTSCPTANHSDRLPKKQQNKTEKNKKEFQWNTFVPNHDRESARIGSATLRTLYTQYNYLLTSQPDRESFHFFVIVLFH